MLGNLLSRLSPACCLRLAGCFLLSLDSPRHPERSLAQVVSPDIIIRDGDLDGSALDFAVAFEPGATYVAWRDTRNNATTGGDIYAQKFDSDGDLLWEANGLAVCTFEGNQQSARDHARWCWRRGGRLAGRREARPWMRFWASASRRPARSNGPPRGCLPESFSRRSRDPSCIARPTAGSWSHGGTRNPSSIRMTTCWRCSRRSSMRVVTSFGISPAPNQTTCGAPASRS
jgi:hypothetical protein